jgi:hypothetical protein
MGNTHFIKNHLFKALQKIIQNGKITLSNLAIASKNPKACGGGGPGSVRGMKAEGWLRVG